MHASVERRWRFDPCDEVAYVVMNDFALMNDHTMLLQGHDKSRISPAGFSTKSRPTQGGGIRNNIAHSDSRSINVSSGKRSSYPQTYTVPKSTEPHIFDADEYVSISNFSGVPSTEGKTMQDEHPNKGKDLLYCDWSELANLDDFEANLRLDDAKDFFPMINTANPINIQQTSSNERSLTSLNHEALACSSGEIEQFSQHSDADVFCPFDNVTSVERVNCCEGLEAIFGSNQEMLATTAASSIMCNNETVSSSTYSAPDLVATYPLSIKNSHDPLNGTPDMILDIMAGNPLEMYFPPLTAYEQPEHLNNATLTQTHQFPEGFAGDDVVKSADLQFFSKGKNSVDLCVNPCSPLILEAVPVKDLGFHKLQEGMNQLDVASKACIRDALYRLANRVEQRHCVASTAETLNRLGTMEPSVSERWREVQMNPMDRSVAQLLLQKPPHHKSPPDSALGIGP
ncbi:uncharacterized protein LOC102708495 isoform X2 [Oryza brachyantha]|uniref:uncharacterized protein LOC102708495 isoform X2 n=1 Tax=Oryza brachyantha TaxID=4533 RepID=UPI0003EAC95F|nr:uncharacterized protein LOC102708495 isoform X2 [Oryza brachyantha]